MTLTRIAQQRYVPISNLPKAEEANAKRFDRNGDGVLQPDEQAAYYSDKTGGRALTNIDELYKVAGGRQRDDRPLHGYFPDTGANVGNFSAPGFGAGNVQVARRVGPYALTGYDDPNRVEQAASVMSVVMNCDLVDLSKIEGDVKEARLVIARAGFEKEMGSTLSEKLVVPMDVTTENAKEVWSNSARRMVTAPDRKFLSATMDMEALWGLAGGRGLSFYAEIEMKDGSVVYLNRDGVSGRNFEISGELLKTT